MQFLSIFAALSCLVFAPLAQAADAFVTDPNSPELRALAKPMEVDESKYGCGPLLHPGKTYYVSLKGDDKADGVSWKTAWRTLRHGVPKLRPGDTLLIGEGEYENVAVTVNALSARYRSGAERGKPPKPQCGAPGRPIRIMAAARQRVVLTSGRKIGPFRLTPGARCTLEARTTLKRIAGLWESDSLITLQNAGSPARVEELPGTYCLDVKERKLYVHWADGRALLGRTVHARGGNTAIRIHGSYYHLKGLQFKHCGWGVLIRSNMDRRTGKYDPKSPIPLGGDHNTLEDCTFFANTASGVILCLGARWNLIKNNRGFNNEYRGAIVTGGTATRDNLIIGNNLGASRPTIRTHGAKLHFPVSNYGGRGPRNHIVNNVLDDYISFRWKAACPQSVVQGNVFTGSFNCTGTAKWMEKPDRVVLRNNVILGNVHWNMEKLGPNGPGGDWAAKDKCFINNFHGALSRKTIAAARFADRSYLDFRLQSDSPLIGKAVGGGDRGAFRRPSGRIFYVSPRGNDDRAGTSVSAPMKTLRRAAAGLKAGDTLYIVSGRYARPLEIDASGEPGRPIRVRAYGRRDVTLPRVELNGSHIRLAGITVARASGDGILVKGADIELEGCLVHGAKRAGVRAAGARGLTLRHCTLAGNRTGLTLEEGAVNATVRSCLLARNRQAAVTVSPDSAQGYRGYNNGYFGAGLDPKRVAAEPGSVVADPLFVNAARGLYRLKGDSPAACLGEFGRPAGSERVARRTATISDIRVSNVQKTSAVLFWRTPVDDTTGRVQYRRRGERRWRSAEDPEQGTVHGVGLGGLEPNAVYECRIAVKARRGGRAESEVLTLQTRSRSRDPMTFYLSPRGNDDRDGRAQATAWRTLRKACFEVQPGDTVLLAPGQYGHPIAPAVSGLPGRRITFRRHGDGEAVIDGGDVVGPLVLLNKRDYVTVDGLTLRRAVKEGWPGVIKLVRCKGVEVLNCRTDKVGWKSGCSVVAQACTDLRIEGNAFWGSPYHFSLASCSDVLIKNNTFVQNTTVGSLTQGRGKNIRILNNLWYQPCIPAKRNPAILLRASALTGVSSDYNLFYSPYKNHKVGVIEGARRDVKVDGTDLLTWRKGSGYDLHSVQADPKFVDLAKGDFRLRPGSPAIGAGKDGANIGAMGVAK